MRRISTTIGSVFLPLSVMTMISMVVTLLEAQAASLEKLSRHLTPTQVYKVGIIVSSSDNCSERSRSDCISRG